MISSAKGIEIKDILKTIFFINLMLIVLHILLYSISMITDYYNLKLIHRGNIIRYSFYFTHPNSFAIYFFWTLALYYYLNFTKLNTYTYFFSLLFALFIYFFVNSRTGTFSIIFLIIFTILTKKNIKLINYKKLFIFLFIFFNLDYLIINTKPIELLDKALSGRIVLARIMFDNYGIKLFGSHIGIIRQSIVNGIYYYYAGTLDCLYTLLTINYGIIPTIIYVFFILKSNCNDIENMFLIIMLFYCITESICISPVVAFPLLFLTTTFKKNISKGENNNEDIKFVF